MSFTEIYAFDKAGIPRLYGVVHNAWRGAMSVWNIMEERHLPPFVPEYIKLCNWYRPGMAAEEIEARNGFKPRRTAPSLSSGKDKDPAREIWALADNPGIPEHERIVLYTTFDLWLFGAAKKVRPLVSFEPRGIYAAYLGMTGWLAGGMPGFCGRKGRLG